jgi:hypothetical protein
MILDAVRRRTDMSVMMFLGDSTHVTGKLCENVLYITPKNAMALGVIDTQNVRNDIMAAAGGVGPQSGREIHNGEERRKPPEDKLDRLSALRTLILSRGRY